MFAFAWIDFTPSEAPERPVGTGFLASLTLPQIVLIAIGALLFLGLPNLVVARAKKAALKDGREFEENWNSIRPYPKQLESSEKILVIAGYVGGIVCLVASIGIS
ncbi:MAG: hypothetical protein OEY37_07195 [Gammaproteobacteria bacterium]|nr:hypothetical protein [Gammaproteobacteria bacterium]